VADRAEWQDDFVGWIDHCYDRLGEGQREYGDASFNAPTDDLFLEIQEELLDVANWSFILYRKIELLKGRTE
jgi:hypothetical protein